MMVNREPIDRDGLLRELRELLGVSIREETQLDGTIVLVGGDPGEVIVRVGGSKVSIALLRVCWDGPHTPVVRPIRFANLNWRRLPAPTLMMTLPGLIAAVREVRTANYRRCERCGETRPPEWMHDQNTCQSCAEQHLGVVH
jgi:hypothetical protein